MAAEHEKRRPADDSEQMLIRRWGQAHWGQAPGPSPITWPCMHAGRREFQLAGAGGLPEEHRKASCSLFPRPLHGRGRHSDRPWATTKHLAAAWSTATRRCKFTRRLARLIAMIGDLPAISVIVSDSRGRLPFAGKDPAEWYPRSATSRRRPANHPSSAHAPRTWLGPSITRRTGGTDREGGSRTGVRR